MTKKGSRTVSSSEARRLALAAQGMTGERPARVTRAALVKTVSGLGLLQLDSVNVFCRAHYVPVFARLGGYAREDLDALAWGPRRGLFEYWGHEASLLPLAMQPLFRWRMERAARLEGMWRMIATFARERRDYVEQVFREVAQRGPVRASELSGAKRVGPSSWFNRSDAKSALEFLFWAGRVTAARRQGFERIYDVPERVLPSEVLALPTPSVADAHRELLRISARALGVATEDDLRDYFRLRPHDARPRIAELVEEGALVEVRVEGWGMPAYLDPSRPIPRTAAARALLSPFDPLVWFRPRALRLFDFHYRIEIYTPAHLREHGYYVLPFLLGDRLVARVDLKAARDEGVLLVAAAHVEGHAEPTEVAPELAHELRLVADWLGLARIRVARKGALAPALRRALTR